MSRRGRVVRRLSPKRRLPNVWRVLIAAPAFVLVVLFAVYATLPDVRPLARRNPETTAFIDLRAREAAAKGLTAKRLQHWTPLSRISPHLRTAVLRTEDAGFFTHEGIDLRELRKSMEVNLDTLSLTRGGSTITQQLAKNLYLSPSKDPLRKFRELLIARLLEGALTKQRILEIYLNVIEWGDRIYGADAAARAHFGVGAGGLSPEQSAMLAGAIANPRLMNPSAPTRRLRARQRMILQRMGYGTRPPDAVAAAAEEDPAKLDEPAPADPSTKAPAGSAPSPPTEALPGVPVPSPAPPPSSPPSSKPPPASKPTPQRR